MSGEDDRSQADLSAELRVEGHDPADYFDYQPEPWQADAELGSNDGAVQGTEAEHQYGEITSQDAGGSRPDAEDVQFSEYEQRQYEYDPESDEVLLHSEHPETGDLEEAIYSGDSGDVIAATEGHDPPGLDDWESGRIGVIARDDYHVWDPQKRNIETFWGWVSNMGSEATNEHSTYWRRVSTLLQATSDTLRGRGDALAQAWQGEAANAFLTQIGGTLYSLDEWDRIASGNAYSLAQVATAIERAQSELGILYGNYWATAHLLDTWWFGGELSQDFDSYRMPIYNPQDPSWDPGDGVTVHASNIIPPFSTPDDLGRLDELTTDYEGGQNTSTVVAVGSREDIQRVYHNRAATIVQELADTFNYENFNGFPEGRRFDGPTGLNPDPGGQPIDTSGLDDFMNQLGNVGIPGSVPNPGAIDMPLLGPTNLPGVPLVDGPAPGFGQDPLFGSGTPTRFSSPDGFLAGVPMAPGLNPAQLAPGINAQQQALASQQAALQQQLGTLNAQQQAQAALNTAMAARAAALPAAGGPGQQPAGGQPIGARVNVPGGFTVPGGVPGVTGPGGVPGVNALGAALPGVTGVNPLGQPNPAGLDGLSVNAQGSPALLGTTGQPGMAGMMPPPPPPMVPPMAGQQRAAREGAQPGAGPLRGAAGMPGAPPPMFIPPGRTSQRGLTPTSPQQVRPALAGTAGRTAARTSGLRGVHNTSPGGQPRPEARPAPASERVPVPGEADQELWTVKKPKGVLQGSEPHRPAPHGKPIGTSG